MIVVTMVDEDEVSHGDDLVDQRCIGPGRIRPREIRSRILRMNAIPVLEAGDVRIDEDRHGPVVDLPSGRPQIREANWICSPLLCIYARSSHRDRNSQKEC